MIESGKFSIICPLRRTLMQSMIGKEGNTFLFCFKLFEFLFLVNFYSVSTIKKKRLSSHGKCTKESVKERQRQLAKVGLSNEEESDERYGGLSVRLLARKKRREKLAEERKKRAEIVR